VDFALAQLTALWLPSVAGATDSPLGAVNYFLNGLSFSALTIPDDSVDVSIFPTVQLSVKNVAVEANDFTWAFQQVAWPRLCGDGVGSARLRGAALKVGLSLAMEGDKVTFALLSNSVELPEVEVSAGAGCKYAWLYNVLLHAFRDRVRTAVEEGVNSVVAGNVGALIEELNELELGKLFRRVQDAAESDS
jgi:hypothetical protein